MDTLRLTGLVGGLLFAVTAAACTAVEPVPSKPRTNETAVRLEVAPKRAEIYIDGQYKGRVEGWRGGIMPISPGDHRVRLTADGYIDQRFDITVKPGETYRLEVSMEPTLDQPLSSG